MEFCQDAFSLVELVIVIALLALIALLSTSTYHTFNRFLVRSELDYLRLLFLCARYKAMALHRTLVVIINSAQHSYTIDNQCYQLCTAVFDYIPGAMGPPAHAYQIINKPVTFIDECINFYADGSISSGTLYVTDKTHTCMYALTIAVNEFGMRIYCYTQTWHLIT